MSAIDARDSAFASSIGRGDTDAFVVFKIQTTPADLTFRCTYMYVCKVILIENRVSQI